MPEAAGLSLRLLRARIHKMLIRIDALAAQQRLDRAKRAADVIAYPTEDGMGHQPPGRHRQHQSACPDVSRARQACRCHVGRARGRWRPDHCCAMPGNTGSTRGFPSRSRPCGLAGCRFRHRHQRCDHRRAASGQHRCQACVGGPVAAASDPPAARTGTSRPTRRITSCDDVTERADFRPARERLLLATSITATRGLLAPPHAGTCAACADDIIDSRPIRRAGASSCSTTRL